MTIPLTLSKYKSNLSCVDLFKTQAMVVLPTDEGALKIIILEEQEIFVPV